MHLLVPLAFGLIPAAFFESAARFSVCPVRRMFGINCPGCGLTRAMSYLIQGDFRRAWQRNKLVAIMFPLLCYIWQQSLVTSYRARWSGNPAKSVDHRWPRG